MLCTIHGKSVTLEAPTTLTAYLEEVDLPKSGLVVEQNGTILPPAAGQENILAHIPADCLLIRVIQYREKEKKRGAMDAACLAIGDMTRQAGATFLVNDHVDLPGRDNQDSPGHGNRRGTGFKARILALRAIMNR
ncbi:thiamine phosphate synthase [Solidesulfovibrio sp.]|uniref:thiamine phosphate synthase n=1 Tax=Solidesulfovibrio sp. TaxID=2910990 RepID=UPI002B1FB8C4|nr:thiamine phosphate synthase [Solidesulfovibrio sp.]MEA4855429.1 thiamine phosphate synthase [Solidesulfovibrio sp.]